MIEEVKNYPVIRIMSPEEFIIHEPLYQCAAVSFEPDILDDPHFLQYTDAIGLFPANELFMGYFADNEYNVECGGFYCEDCLKGMGFDSNGRPTLQQMLDLKDWYKKEAEYDARRNE